MKNLLNRGKVIFQYFSASLIPMILSLAINPFVAMNMSPEDYSISGYYTAFSSLITPIVLFYFLHYYQKRYFEVNLEERVLLKSLIVRSLIVTSAILSILCFIGLYIYVKFLAPDFSFPIFPYLLFVVTTAYLGGIYNFQLSEYKMSRQPKKFSNLSIFTGVLSSSFVLVFVVLLKLGAWGKLFAPMFCSFIIFIYLVYKNRNIWKIKIDVKEYKIVLVFCLPLAVGSALGYFMNGFDRTYLEQIGNITEYGNYIVGVQIGLYVNIFASAISTTFSPDICESIATNNTSRFWKYSYLQIGLIAAIVLIFILLCPLTIKILTAGRYMGAVPYASIIALSSVTSSIYYIVNYYSIATNRPKLYLYTTIIGSIIIIFLYPIIIPKFKYIGGAIMVVSSYIILLVINLALLKIIKK